MIALVALMGVCILIVYAVVGVGTAGGPAGDRASTPTVKGESYEDARLGFAFEYPADWVKADSPAMGADATFLGPRRSDFTMSLDVRHDESAMALAVYVDRTIRKVLPEYKTNFKLLDEEPRTVEGVEAIKVVYSYRQGDFDLINVQVVYGLEARKIVLTFCLLSEYQDEVMKQVEQTIESFRRLS